MRISLGFRHITLKPDNNLHVGSDRKTDKPLQYYLSLATAESASGECVRVGMHPTSQ